jgi:hypothetical protein
VSSFNIGTTNTAPFSEGFNRSYWRFSPLEKATSILGYLIKIHYKKKLDGQWTEPVSLTFYSVLSKLYTEPSIGASYQISVHLANRFQRIIFFLEINQKQELPVVAMFVDG